MSAGSTLPVLDLRPLWHNTADLPALAHSLHRACRASGFFYITHHGIPSALITALERQARTFFALPLDQKQQLSMSHGGRAWRGYFPVGSELTSGQPDIKEGLYLGQELPLSHPLVQAQTPLHGANLFPTQLPGFRETVLAYLDALTALGQQLMRLIALSLELPPDYFARHVTADPLVLFRLFHYPALPSDEQRLWSVGEHTDYGLLTLLWQDEHGGLEVRTREGWIEAPPMPGSFVCNIGDMLDKMTCGLYRSTPHRVRNVSGAGRLSMPLFFDPGFEAEIAPIHPKEATLLDDDWETRWDRASVHAFRGRYGAYVQQKVSKVFPELWGEVTSFTPS
ncbi:MAG: isopenicillin N synthase family dioxygenase [Myxococcota bacterium]